jgi:hypothetical protein
VLAADERVANADPPGRPIDVAPAQPKQLGLAQPGHRRGQYQDPQDRSKNVRGRRWRGTRAARACRLRLAIDDTVGNRAQDGIELSHGQELEIRAGVALSAALRPSSAPDRILGHPARLDRMLEDRMQDVARRLGLSASRKHRLGQRLNVGWLDLHDRLLQMDCDVNAGH